MPWLIKRKWNEIKLRRRNIHFVLGWVQNKLESQKAAKEPDLQFFHYFLID